MLSATAAVLLAILPVEPSAAVAPGAVPLFNGKDLAGWVNVNGS
ncbi:MAG: DUF1080 domain-containing protein, partial [Phycisphaerae bacterium]|nr:DUF1080 domain-containing protein [Phycisphaerae bacterium]